MNRKMGMLLYIIIVMLLATACSKEEQGEKPEALPPTGEEIIEEPEEAELTYRKCYETAGFIPK